MLRDVVFVPGQKMYACRMVNHSLTETYDNDSHFDLTFIICVWITFLPTVRWWYLIDIDGEGGFILHNLFFWVWIKIFKLLSTPPDIF